MPISVGDEIDVSSARPRRDRPGRRQRPLHRGRHAGALRVDLADQQGEDDDFSMVRLEEGSLILAAVRLRRPGHSAHRHRGRDRVRQRRRPRPRQLRPEPWHGRHRARRDLRSPHARRQLPRAGRRVPDGRRRRGARDRARRLLARPVRHLGRGPLRGGFEIAAAPRRSTWTRTTAATSWPWTGTATGATTTPTASNVWRPRVAAGGRPYSNGSWYYTPVGLTWWSYDPWGWYPFHYGNWFFDASLEQLVLGARLRLLAGLGLLGLLARLRRLVPRRLVLVLLALVQQLLPATGATRAAAASISRSTGRSRPATSTSADGTSSAPAAFGAAGPHGRHSGLAHRQTASAITVAVSSRPMVVTARPGRRRVRPFRASSARHPASIERTASGDSSRARAGPGARAHAAAGDGRRAARTHGRSPSAAGSPAPASPTSRRAAPASIARGPSRCREEPVGSDPRHDVRLRSEARQARPARRLPPARPTADSAAARPTGSSRARSSAVTRTASKPARATAMPPGSNGARSPRIAGSPAHAPLGMSDPSAAPRRSTAAGKRSSSSRERTNPANQPAYQRDWRSQPRSVAPRDSQPRMTQRSTEDWRTRSAVPPARRVIEGSVPGRQVPDGGRIDSAPRSSDSFGRRGLPSLGALARDGAAPAFRVAAAGPPVGAAQRGAARPRRRRGWAPRRSRRPARPRLPSRRRGRLPDPTDSVPDDRPISSSPRCRAFGRGFFCLTTAETPAKRSFHRRGSGRLRMPGNGPAPGGTPPEHDLRVLLHGRGRLPAAAALGGSAGAGASGVRLLPGIRLGPRIDSSGGGTGGPARPLPRACPAPLEGP